MARTKEFERDIALLEALRVFWAKGYEGASVTNLTEAMGISKSSLYDTFGDKDALFLEALRHYIGHTAARRAAVLAGDATVRRKMEAMLLGAVNFLLNEDNPGGCFFTNTATVFGTMTAAVQEEMKRGMEAMEEDYIRLFEDGKERGELPRDWDSRKMARFFVACIRGLGVMVRIHPRREVLEDVVSAALRVIP